MREFWRFFPFVKCFHTNKYARRSCYRYLAQLDHAH